MTKAVAAITSSAGNVHAEKPATMFASR